MSVNCKLSLMVLSSFCDATNKNSQNPGENSNVEVAVFNKISGQKISQN